MWWIRHNALCPWAWSWSGCWLKLRCIVGLEGSELCELSWLFRSHSSTDPFTSYIQPHPAPQRHAKPITGIYRGQERRRLRVFITLTIDS